MLGSDVQVHGMNEVKKGWDSWPVMFPAQGTLFASFHVSFAQHLEEDGDGVSTVQLTLSPKSWKYQHGPLLHLISELQTMLRRTPPIHEPYFGIDIAAETRELKVKG